jgi:hypothetical protein
MQVLIRQAGEVDHHVQRVAWVTLHLDRLKLRLLASENLAVEVDQLILVAVPVLDQSATLGRRHLLPLLVIAG